MMKFLLGAVLWMLIGAVLLGSFTLENIDVACMMESAVIESKLDAVTDHFLHAFSDYLGAESLMKPIKDQLTEKLDKLENFFWSIE